MKVEIRIAGSVYAAAIADLNRPHPFAAERVGFLSTAIGKISSDHVLLLGHSYSSLPDEHYVDDLRAGACIGSNAIRASLQRVLSTGSGQLHVHVHDHYGQPRPSATDLRDMPPLIKSLSVTGPNCAHGAIIFSRDRAWAQVAVPGSPRLVEATTVTVIGFPFLFLKR